LTPKSLADWLRWQESLHPRAIELGLDRVREVAARLDIRPPPGAVFTVTGTNGKGSTVDLLDRMLRRAGRLTAAYTSPHLVRYNERVAVGGTPAGDGELVAACEAVEQARRGVLLTFFEFGTLAALQHFTAAGADCWILEVGLGGRLDAVNIIDPDYSLVTTIGLDHRDWLGDNLGAIAAEKAGIMRPGRPAFYGDTIVADVIRTRADTIGARLHCLQNDFRWKCGPESWNFSGRDRVLQGLPSPPGGLAHEYRNASLALAALEQFDAAVLEPGIAGPVIAGNAPAGRGQLIARDREWLLDVAHNPQAAAALRARIDTLPAAPVTIVIGMLADKPVDAVIEPLLPIADRWITTSVEDRYGLEDAELARRLRDAGAADVRTGGPPVAALSRARECTARGARIVVCGSFRVVGPALEWLGLY